MFSHDAQLFLVYFTNSYENLLSTVLACMHSYNLICHHYAWIIVYPNLVHSGCKFSGHVQPRAAKYHISCLLIDYLVSCH